MNKFECLHETPIRTALDLMDIVSKYEPEDILDATKRSPYASTSIAKIASNMTLVFPMMASNTLHIDTTMMLMKAIERKCAVMLQILFSAFQVTDVKDAQEFISKFHSNIRLGNKASVDDFIALAEILGESTSIKVDHKIIETKLSKDFRENCFFVLEDDIAPLSISDRYTGINEARNANSRNHYNGSDKGPSIEKQMKDKEDYFRNQIMDSDIKKANELVPTTMVVNFTTVSPKTGKPIPVENIVIGVKCRFIPIDSDDIINHLLTKINDKNFLTQLIRATTREISFFKDFIFAIDNAKIEALANSRRGSSNPMWKVLERRAIMSRLNRTIGIRGNNANAITTLVVSQEEVDYVRKNHGKNFDSIRVINTLLDAYNLLGFVIADESLEVAKFKFDDGENQFETLAFSTLEKEAGDNNYKKIVNLMTKIS